MLGIKGSTIAAKLSRRALSILVAVAMLLLLSGCAEYGHIPLAGHKNTAQKSDTIQVTLQWNDVPDAASYNVYWSRFPGVTRHNGHKITGAANPITITDLEPAATYFFVVTVVDGTGESQESKEMSFAAAGVVGTIDFKDLFKQQAPSLTPPAGQEKAQSQAGSQATLTWDDVPGAVSYNIYWRNQPGVTKHNGTKIANVQNPHTLKNLIPGKTYYLVVTAVSKDGESKISEEISYPFE